MKIPIIFLLCLIPFFCSSQDVLSIDIATNTVKRTKIKTDTNKISSHDLMYNYLHEINGNFRIESEKYNDVFNEELRVGEYLVFEIINVPANSISDSVAISYQFVNRNMEHASTFANFINSRLPNLQSISTPDDPNKNKVRITGLQNLATKIKKSNSTNLVLSPIPQFALDNNHTSLANFSSRLTQYLGVNTDQALAQLPSSLTEETKITAILEVLKDTLNINAILVDSFQSSLDTIFTEISDKTFLYDTVSLELEIIEDDQSNNPPNNRIKSTSKDSIRGFQKGLFGKSNKSEHFKFIPLQVQNKDYTYIYVTGFKKGRQVYNRVYEFHNKCGFKADFSVGFVASRLRDYNYVLKPTIDSTTMEIDGNEILKLDQGNFYIGIAIHGHFYTRIARRFNVAISPGFAVNTDSRVNYLLGLSAILGKDQRFILNIGMAFGKVLRLSNVYEVGQKLDLGITELPTIEQWNKGLYFGVSYNI